MDAEAARAVTDTQTDRHTHKTTTVTLTRVCSTQLRHAIVNSGLMLQCACVWLGLVPHSMEHGVDVICYRHLKQTTWRLL